MKSYIAEVLGTCLLTLALILAATLGPWIGAVLAGFILMFVAYTIGHVSGAHINPAITIGALSVGKITPMRAFYYIISQLAGAALALVVLHLTHAVSPSEIDSKFSWVVFTGEVVGMGLFAFGIASLLFKRVDAATTGFVAGISLFLGLIVSLLLVASSGGSTFLNPAVAFGLSSVSIASILGPILGSIIGMWLYVVISEDVKATASHVKHSFKA